MISGCAQKIQRNTYTSKDGRYIADRPQKRPTSQPHTHPPPYTWAAMDVNRQGLPLHPPRQDPPTEEYNPASRLHQQLVEGLAHETQKTVLWV